MAYDKLEFANKPVEHLELGEAEVKIIELYDTYVVYVQRDNNRDVISYGIFKEEREAYTAANMLREALYFYDLMSAATIKELQDANWCLLEPVEVKFFLRKIGEFVRSLKPKAFETK